MQPHHLVIFLCWLQSLCYLSQAQRFGILHPEAPAPEVAKDPFPKDPEPANPGAGKNPPEPPKAAKPIIPGAIAQGEEPYASADDEEVDIEEIGEKLQDLIDAISSLIHPETSIATVTANNSNGFPITRTFTVHRPTITPFHLPNGAEGCMSARSAYQACSSASANFSALPRPEQAGCLCNASPHVNFNALMRGCHSWANAQNATTSGTASEFPAYATAIANATTICAASACQSATSSQACLAPTSTSTTALSSTPSSTTVAPMTAGAAGGVTVDVGRVGGRFLIVTALWAAMIGFVA